MFSVQPFESMITDEQITTYGLPIGLFILMGYMVFIIYKLGKDSKAGKFGMMILFVVLAFGLLGFVMKYVIKLIISSGYI